MRITTRGRYALRASLALARLQEKNTPVSVSQLSESEQISSVFLEQIFFKLRKAGIVKSVRGPGGGFMFAKSLDKISVYEILDAAGEELDITDCDKNGKACIFSGKNCSSHSVWKDLTHILKDYFCSLTLEMILTKEIPEPSVESQHS